MTGLSACLPVYSTDAIRRKVVQFAFLLSPPSLKPKTLNIFACRLAFRWDIFSRKKGASRLPLSFIPSVPLPL